MIVFNERERKIEPKRILIIFDEDKYDRQMILDDLKLEGFPHFYKFGNEVDKINWDAYIWDSDELWVFGDVRTDKMYKVALELGVEVWQMA